MYPKTIPECRPVLIRNVGISRPRSSHQALHRLADRANHSLAIIPEAKLIPGDPDPVLCTSGRLIGYSHTPYGSSGTTRASCICGACL